MILTSDDHFNFTPLGSIEGLTTIKEELNTTSRMFAVDKHMTTVDNLKDGQVCYLFSAAGIRSRRDGFCISREAAIRLRKNDDYHIKARYSEDIDAIEILNDSKVLISLQHPDEPITILNIVDRYAIDRAHPVFLRLVQKKDMKPNFITTIKDFKGDKGDGYISLDSIKIVGAAFSVADDALISLLEVDHYSVRVQWFIEGFQLRLFYCHRVFSRSRPDLGPIHTLDVAMLAKDYKNADAYFMEDTELLERADELTWSNLLKPGMSNERIKLYALVALALSMLGIVFIWVPLFSYLYYEIFPYLFEIGLGIFRNLWVVN